MSKFISEISGDCDLLILLSMSIIYHVVSASSSVLDLSISIYSSSIFEVNQVVGVCIDGGGDRSLGSLFFGFFVLWVGGWWEVVGGCGVLWGACGQGK
jgi:hypothetical protein